MQMSPAPELCKDNNASEKYRELKVSNHPTQGQQNGICF